MNITLAQGPFLPIPPLAGGAIEKFFFPLAQYWASRGHAVTHISRRYKNLPDEETIGGIRHLRVPSRDSTGSLLIDKFSDATYSLNVSNLLKKLPPADILITHSFFLPILARNPGHHGLVYVHAARFPKGQLPLYGRAVRIQFPSQAVLQAALRQSPRLASIFIVIPNALPHMPPPPAPRQSLAAPFKFLYAGRVHPEKGIHLLLESLALLPTTLQSKINLRIVGPYAAHQGGGGEQYLSTLKSLSNKTSARVEFAEPIFDPAALAREYAAADLFVYPSLAERGETFGVSPLEALSHGTPALVSDLDCFKDFIIEGQNGFIFDHRAGDPASQLSKKIARALEKAGAWPMLSSSAYATAQKFRLESVGDLFIKDFENLISIYGKK